MKQGIKIFITIFCSFFIFFGIYAAENEFLNKGLSYYQNKEFELSSAHLEEAKKLEPRNSNIYFYLGNSYYQMNELDSAIVNYTAGLDYAEKKGPFFYNLGNCYFLKDNFKFSSDMYAQAILHDPLLFDSYLNAGNAYYRSGDYAKTIIHWETYLEKYPQTPQYESIEKAIAYLREEIERQAAEQRGIDAETGLDVDLLGDVLEDLEGLINRTENLLETSEKAVDDLSIEEIER
jgi:tetratricopeptide (TPR) repeat protein